MKHETDLRLFGADSTIFDDIRLWAQERGLYDSGDVKTQMVKLTEEFGELGRAIIKNNNDLFADSVGDMIIVLTNLVHLKHIELVGNDLLDEGLTIEDCILKAWDEIKNRTGKMVDGTFVKD